MTNTHKPDAHAEPHGVKQTDDSAAAGPGSSAVDGSNRDLLIAVSSLVGGLLALVVVFANLSRLTGWADEYGTVWVYLAYFLVLSVAGRAFWKGADFFATRLWRRSR